LLFIPSCTQVALSIIGVPHVEEGIVNPIKEFIIPSIIQGDVSWNLIELLGLVWPWSVITLISLIALICVWAFRSTCRDQSRVPYEHVSFPTVTFLLGWICAIALTLVVLKT